MKIIEVGSIAWEKGNLSLNGWHIDLEGKEYAPRALEEAAARCAIEIMMDDVGIDLERSPTFEVERMAGNVIFDAMVTSSPAMMREISPKWYERLMWWKR